MKSKIAIALMCLSFSFLAQNAFASFAEVTSRGGNDVNLSSGVPLPSPCEYISVDGQVIVICKPLQKINNTLVNQ